MTKFQGPVDTATLPAAKAAPRLNWQPLLTIHVHPFFSKQLKERLTEFNETTVPAHLAEREKLEEQRAKLAATRIEDLDLDNTAICPMPRGNMIVVLQEELKIRKLAAELLDEVKTQTLAQSEKVFAKIEPAKALLRKQLVEAGYVDVGTDIAAAGPVPGSIKPVMINDNPRVRNLVNEYEALQSQASDNAREAQNVQADDMVRAQLEDFRRQALSAAS